MVEGRDESALGGWERRRGLIKEDRLEEEDHLSRGHVVRGVSERAGVENGSIPALLLLLLPRPLIFRV